jgi:hypothetical protein
MIGLLLRQKLILKKEDTFNVTMGIQNFRI